MDRRPVWPGRLGAVFRHGWARVARLPRGPRLALIGAAVVAAFVAVVLPLFSSGGPARAEVAGQLPAAVTIGRPARGDIAIDNTGTTSIDPICVMMSGRGARLISVNFQGLDQVSATSNRACGGQLTGQQTISLTIVFTLSAGGTTAVQITPEQGGTAVGPPLTQKVIAS